MSECFSVYILLLNVCDGKKAQNVQQRNSSNCLMLKTKRIYSVKYLTLESHLVPYV